MQMIEANYVKCNKLLHSELNYVLYVGICLSGSPLVACFQEIKIQEEIAFWL